MESPRPPAPHRRSAPPSCVVLADLVADDPMSREGMSSVYIEQLVRAHDSGEVSLHWRGLVPAPEGPRRFRGAAAMAERLRRPDVHLRHRVDTTAELLDEEWASCLAERRATVRLEVGGPELLTHPSAPDACDMLDRHEVDIDVMCSVDAVAARHPLDIYRFLRDSCHAESIEWVPVVEREGEGVTPATVTGEDWGKFLITVFDEWVRRDVGEVVVVNFEAALGKWMGASDGPCIFEETCGRSLALSSDGSLFSCDRFEDDAHRLGNVTTTRLVELISKPEQMRFGLAKKSTLPGYCLKCPVKFACNGECPKHRFARTPDGEEGLNHLCAGYRAFFTHIDGPMRRMVELLAAGHFLEEVMDDHQREAPREQRPARP